MIRNPNKVDKQIYNFILGNPFSSAIHFSFFNLFYYFFIHQTIQLFVEYFISIEIAGHPNQKDFNAKYSALGCDFEKFSLHFLFHQKSSIGMNRTHGAFLHLWFGNWFRAKKTVEMSALLDIADRSRFQSFSKLYKFY